MGNPANLAGALDRGDDRRLREALPRSLGFLQREPTD
jgi:hypothetical protein